VEPLPICWVHVRRDDLEASSSRRVGAAPFDVRWHSWVHHGLECWNPWGQRDRTGSGVDGWLCRREKAARCGQWRQHSRWSQTSETVKSVAGSASGMPPAFSCRRSVTVLPLSPLIRLSFDHYDLRPLIGPVQCVWPHSFEVCSCV